MSLKIVQLSDSHLPADPEKPYRGENADANLERVWKKARAWGPDLVLLTGDLSEDASEASYERMARIIDARVPILALPGNHDEHEAMKEKFPHGPWAGPLAWESGNWLIVMTDSTAPGHVEGRFSESALMKIRAVMAKSERDHILLALHHQPVPVDAPWIDKYPLVEAEDFLGMVDSEPRIRCVLWGHIHHHFALERNGVLFLGSPSTAANSLPRADRFDPDPAGASCHRIELGESGSVAYGQLYASAR